MPDTLIAEDREGIWKYAALVGLVPVAPGWLIAYALIYLVRWIRAGFAKQ
jgi:hypothetical protein